VLFVKYLRDGIRSGDITSTIRIWRRPHVTAGKRYRMEDGEIEVESIVPIALAEITPAMAREKTCIWSASTTSHQRVSVRSEFVSRRAAGSEAADFGASP
jgi:hypothetical protein